MKGISVVIGTFGDVKWMKRAERAVDSAHVQSVAPIDVIQVHCATLDEARNSGAESARGEWLCFLDADDELDPGYIRAMLEAIGDSDQPRLFQPATLGVVGDREDAAAVMIPKRPLIDGNYMVIGTVVQREQFLRLGGFADYRMYEDWDMWIRCALDGATHVPVPEAIYRVHVNEASRNKQNRDLQVAVYNEIRNKHLGHPMARKI